MTDRWPMVRLGAVLRQSLDQHKVQPDASYPNFGIYSFGRGLFAKEPINGGTSSAASLYKAHARQFVYSRLFAFEGAYGVVPQQLDGGFVSNEFPLFDCDEARLHVEYLGWLFRVPRIWEEVATLSTGMGDRRRRVKPEQLLTYTIPLPPLPEQRRIVAKIDELAAKIEEARGLRRDARDGLDRLPEAHAKAILSQLSAQYLRPLGSLVEVRGGGTPSKANPFFWKGPIPWVSPKDMKVREIKDSTDHISEEATRSSTARLLDSGAVLIVVRGMILVHTVPSAVLRVPAAINQDMKALVAKPGLAPEYLCNVLWALNGQLLNLVEKSTHDTRKLETPKLLDFAVPVPPLEEQRRIVAHLDDLQAKADRLKDLQAKTAAELDALLPSILDKAFKGEL